MSCRNLVVSLSWRILAGAGKCLDGDSQTVSLLEFGRVSAHNAKGGTRVRVRKAPEHRGSLELNQRNILFRITGDSAHAVKQSRTNRDESARRQIMF
ncbi:MAG: hypothetical protein K8R59_17035 [Thermoanaerobaculales bacterium]|nr:hypothetical protein [Thermoanaerobaculales bacterium]